MRSVALLVLLSGGIVAAETRTALLPVTVVLDFEQGSNSLPLTAVHSELQKLMRNANVSVELRLREELPDNPDFREIVIFKMKGHCAAAPVLPVGALSDERGALAMTYTNEGQILPFGAVQCDQVRKSLTRVYGTGLNERQANEFGVAIARVMAHEMYHMLGDSKSHTKSGVTKESLSAHELAESRISVPRTAEERVRQRLPAETSR